MNILKHEFKDKIMGNMSISNSISRVSHAIYEGCKAVYKKTVHPLVHLVCKILFSDIPHYTGKIVCKVTHPFIRTQATTVRVEEAVSSVLPFKKESDEKEPVDLAYSQPELFHPDLREEFKETVGDPVEERRESEPRRESEQEELLQEPIDREQRNEIEEAVNYQGEEKRECEPREVLKQPVQAEIKEFVPQLPVAIKSTKIHVGNSNIPFYLSRLGFPNFSYRNCSYNSLSVVCAHTGYSMPAIHPNNERLYAELKLSNAEEFERVLGQKIDECDERIALEEINLAEMREQKKKELAAIESLIEPAKNEFEEMQSQVATINFREWKIVDNGLQTLRKELEELKQKHKTDASEALKTRIYKLQIEINNREIGQMVLDKTVSAEEEKINTKLESKKNAWKSKEKELKDKNAQWELKMGRVEQEITSIQFSRKNFETALEYQENLKRGTAILAILRGEIQGSLTMEDAQLLTVILGSAVEPRILYKGPEDVREDVGSVKLKEALYHSNWRALRVGGYGHWWVYVRNSDGLTIDEINDAHIYRKRMTIDELFATYSKPDEWRNTQITFYDGIEDSKSK